MIRGIYTGATGMLSQQRRLDVVSNNLANVNTSGFKRDFLVDAAFPEAPMYRLALGGSAFVGTLGFGADTPVVHTDFTQGQIRVTDNPLDLALESEGYFVVSGGEGEYYTRSGHFFRDSAGYLVNASGEYVLGSNGPIEISGSNINIGTDGQVVVDGELRDRLRVVRFADRSGTKIGDSLWASQNIQEVSDPRVFQGALESSNVNTVKEMVDMITVTRAYEANQRLITTQDEILDKAVNEIGRT